MFSNPPYQHIAKVWLASSMFQYHIQRNLQQLFYTPIESILSIVVYPGTRCVVDADRFLSIHYSAKTSIRNFDSTGFLVWECNACLFAPIEHCMLKYWSTFYFRGANGGIILSKLTYYFVFEGEIKQNSQTVFLPLTYLIFLFIIYNFLNLKFIIFKYGILFIVSLMFRNICCVINSILPSRK